MDNNIQKYKAFLKVVEMGSFTGAANALDYTQSSISKMIADLENEWNMVLLERGRGGVYLTSAGEQVVPYVRNLLDDYERLENHVNDINGIQTGTIRIGTFASVAINCLPDAFDSFRKDYPGIEYEMLLGDYEEVERWIDEGRVDFGFISLPSAGRFETVTFRRDEYKVVLPHKHRIASHKKIDIHELEGEPFMLLEHGGRTEVTKLLEQNNVHPDIRFTTWEDYAIMAMVEKGLGVGILPDMILKKIPYDIVIRSLKVPYYREIGIAFKSRERLSAAAVRFMEKCFGK